MDLQWCKLKPVRIDTHTVWKNEKFTLTTKKKFRENFPGEAYGLDKVALNHVESVTVEHENQVQVSINKVMSYLKQVNIEKSKQICKQTAD